MIQWWRRITADGRKEGEREEMESEDGRRVRRGAHRLLQSRRQSVYSNMPTTPMGNGNVPTNAPSSSNERRAAKGLCLDDGDTDRPSPLPYRWPSRSSSVRLVIDTGRRQIGPFRPAAADGPTTSGQRPAENGRSGTGSRWDERRAGRSHNRPGNSGKYGNGFWPGFPSRKNGGESGPFQ